MSDLKLSPEAVELLLQAADKIELHKGESAVFYTPTLEFSIRGVIVEDIHIDGRRGLRIIGSQFVKEGEDEA